ncbi:MAG: site-2 protease family protein [Thermoplasmata archaeon]
MDQTVKVQSEDLEYVVNVVKSKINVYDVVVNPVSIKFYFFDSDNPDIDGSFDAIRRELVDKGYIPFLSRDGENFIQVTRSPQRKYMGNIVNAVLLVATIISTMYVGSVYSRNFVPLGSDYNLRLWLYGFIFFSAPLLLILGIHESAHFIVAKKHHVKASLPFFIPFPLGIGTFGAFISLRDPLPNRKAMAEIGAAGPIAGFITALPLLFVADYFQRTFKPIPPYYIPFKVTFPLIYHILGLQTNFTGPIFPMVFAVWVGMFATAMNLIPAGQLDGSHILRGVLGKRANVFSYVFLAFLFVIGFYYDGWWIIAIFVIFTGLVHPPALNDFSKISKLDIAIGAISLIMFIITFTIVPIVAT